jgi:hypothetical protein
MNEIDINKIIKEFYFNITMDGYAYKHRSNRNMKAIYFKILSDNDDISEKHLIKECKVNLMNLILFVFNQHTEIFECANSEYSNFYNALELDFYPEDKKLVLSYVHYNEAGIEWPVILNPYPFNYIFEKDENNEYKYNWLKLYDIDKLREKIWKEGCKLNL